MPEQPEDAAKTWVTAAIYSLVALVFICIGLSATAYFVPKHWPHYKDGVCQPPSRWDGTVQICTEAFSHRLDSPMAR